MLNAKDIACLARDVATVLPDTVTLSRATSASDGLGGRSNTFASLGTKAARVAPVSTQQAEEEIGGRLKDGTYYRIAFAAGTDVRTGDRIAYSGLTLSVEAVQAPRSVEVERVTYAVRAAT